MKKRHKLSGKHTACLLLWLLLLPIPPVRAYASEYITISIDATDDNGIMKYALDTDDPAAFTDSNEFTIPAGTTHTIYVKDEAGNITSQTYTPEPEEEEDEQKINIELEIGGSNNNYENPEDTPMYPHSGTGTATVSEKVNTDGSDMSPKVFYTFTTKEGEVLYLVIDQGKPSDNVYLLDTVSVSDLRVLADNGEASAAAEKEDNLLAALTKGNDKDGKDNTAPNPSSASNSSDSNMMIIALICITAAGGIYYYFKIYKDKKERAMDVMDAMDMDEFAPEEPEEEDEVEFDLNDTEKERYLEELMNDDDKSLYDTDPEDYAAPYMDDDYDSGIDASEIDGYEESEEEGEN